MAGRATAGLALAICIALPAPAFAQDDKAAAGGVTPAGATPRGDDFGGFRNVLPGGQGETVDAVELAQNQATGAMPKSFTDQLPLYTDLLYAAPTLTAADLDKYFKPAGFGLPSADVAATDTPKPGVTIVRDRQFNVPHVYGATRADTMFGAGYASGQDRMFLMDVLRHTGRARLSELIGPGGQDANVKADAEQLKIADYSEEELQRMIDEGRRTAGAEGEAVYQDLLAYVAGINAYIAEARSDASKMPGEYAALGKTLNDWKPTDTVAVASLIGGIFGRGGGGEAINSEILRALQERFGNRKARSVFGDFRRAEDPEAPVTTPRRFPFDDPGRRDPKAIAALDPDSFTRRDPTTPVSHNEPERPPEGGNPSPLPIPIPLPLGTLGLKGPASNALLVRGSRTPSGRPVAVMGPQVGYYSPQILLELDLHGPGIDARGAAFPGISLYVLLGRGQDFAWSATTATTDVVDEFVEKLCEPDGSRPTPRSKHYLYKGRCIPLLRRDHVIQTTPSPTSPGSSSKTYTLKVERSVHGPIQGYGEVRGQPVAIAEARSTYFHELDSAIAFKRLNSNEVNSAQTFQQAMNRVNFAFNWFYVDDRDIAYLQSGWYPRRARGVDPNLPAWGTGEWDWRGFDPEAYSSARLPFRSLPKDVNPARGYIVSWNNKQAPGWRAADDNWVYGSVHRSERLERRVALGLRRGGKIDLTRLTQIMEEGATVDVRGQEVYPWIKRVIGRSSDPEVRSLLDVLDAWRKNGAHRRDLDRDNVLDESPAVLLMDAWWEPLVRGIFQPRLSLRVVEQIRKVADFHQPAGPGGSAFFTGWYGHVEKDLRTILGKRVRGKLSRRYCGSGSRRLCRETLERTLKETAAGLRRRLGDDMTAWKLPATCREAAKPQACDQIEFTTAGAVATPPIHWQDRPTFQQIVEVQGHRPR